MKLTGSQGLWRISTFHRWKRKTKASPLVLVSLSQLQLMRNTKPLGAEDRPCVVKNHILHEVRLFCTEHGGSRGVNLEQKSHYWQQGSGECPGRGTF